MRAFTTDHKSALAEEVTYQGWLLSLTPVGLDPVYLTTIGTDYTYGGDVYLGDPGYVQGDITFSDGSSAPTMAVAIPCSDDGPIYREKVERGLYVGAEVVVRIVDFENDHVSPPIGFKWVVGATTITDDGDATFEIRAKSRIQRELILKKIGPVCSANFGDSRCGVDVLGLWTDTVAVVSVVDSYSFTISGARLTAVDDFYANGAIKFESGDNINRAYTVRTWDQSTSTVTLWEPLRAGLTAGDTGLIHKGCNKSRGVGGCADVDNIPHFQGFADLPDDDATFRNETADGGTQEQPSTVDVEAQPKTYQWSTGRWI